MTDLMHLVSSYQLLDDNEAKYHGLYLAPFINFAVVYFVFVPNIENVIVTTILKCLPIFCLIFYVVMKGFAFSKEYRYSQLISMGLLFSSLGDAFLNQADMFPHGMMAFGIAHAFYISALGWKPLKWPIGVGFYIFTAVVVAVAWNQIDEVIVAIGLPIYGLLLTTTCWRAIALAIEKPIFLRVLCAIGTVLFLISDGFICLDMFIVRVNHAGLIIMITYYLAQLGIALSTAVEAKKFTKKPSPKRSKQSIQSRISNAESLRRRGKSRD